MNIFFGEIHSNSEDIDKILGHDDVCELEGQVVDTFEDYFEEEGIRIEGQEDGEPFFTGGNYDLIINALKINTGRITDRHEIIESGMLGLKRELQRMRLNRKLASRDFEEIRERLINLMDNWGITGTVMAQDATNIK